jgi:hypothetical protein
MIGNARLVLEKMIKEKERITLQSARDKPWSRERCLLTRIENLKTEFQEAQIKNKDIQGKIAKVKS